MLGDPKRGLYFAELGTADIPGELQRPMRPVHECISMLDAIATIILVGMMLIPGINVLVGIVAGGASFGVSGGFAGAAIAVLITLAENQLIDRRRVGSPRPSAEIVSFPNPSLWRPVPAFEANEAISAALRKLAARSGYVGTIQDALAS